jgi:riboflavin kinase/FMN adenylyltransferase
VHWGARPTFGEEGPVLEAHLLGWAGGPLYGRRLDVEFVERLRDVVRFETVEELAREMESDLRRAAAAAGAP